MLTMNLRAIKGLTIALRYHNERHVRTLQNCKSFAECKKQSNSEMKKQNTLKSSLPGIEPGSPVWKTGILAVVLQRTDANWLPQWDYEIYLAFVSRGKFHLEPSGLTMMHAQCRIDAVLTIWASRLTLSNNTGDFGRGWAVKLLLCHVQTLSH